MKHGATVKLLRQCIPAGAGTWNQSRPNLDLRPTSDALACLPTRPPLNRSTARAR